MQSRAVNWGNYPSGPREPFPPHIYSLAWIVGTSQQKAPSPPMDSLFLYFILTHLYLQNLTLYNLHMWLHRQKIYIYSLPGRSEFYPDRDILSHHPPVLKSSDAGRGRGNWQVLSSNRQEGNSPVACLLLSQGVLTGLRMGEERDDVRFQPRKEWQVSCTIQRGWDSVVSTKEW